MFVGAGSPILYGVWIGSNVIIGAGSLVNKDIPSNSVVGAVPARVISTFNEYVSKRRMDNVYTTELKFGNEFIGDATAVWYWEEFYKAHNVKNE